MLGAIGWLMFNGMRVFLTKEQVFVHRDQLIFAVSLASAMLVLSLVDGVFYYGTPLSVLMVSLGIIGAEVVRNKQGLETIPVCRIEVTSNSEQDCHDH